MSRGYFNLVLGSVFLMLSIARPELLNLMVALFGISTGLIMTLIDKRDAGKPGKRGRIIIITPEDPK